ncbi:hypothetical protein MKQ70_02640 [Chitinophaga sedimenti]|uniref:hypothetical protein n=1 Tax=Chitinophaga sedimenti TaxID=2033606 RepID=UPI0020038369|nr:hypothetical protein [Chitinophaga sedimenti]MCK7553963.1 hypothetical protein [Chitinophaga sedimenti]
MKLPLLSILPIFVTVMSTAQPKADLKGFVAGNGVTVRQQGSLLDITWPAGTSATGKVTFDLSPAKPLFKRVSLDGQPIATNIDPAFLLTVGKRDLLSQNGWNIFFDKVPTRPFDTYPLAFRKTAAAVKSEGSRTIVTIGQLRAETFEGSLEVTFYNGSPMFNVAAVIASPKDAKAIVFDAGLISQDASWQKVSWINTGDSLMQQPVRAGDTAQHLAVKYRSIAASGAQGALAVFPPPHQYFYPLDEAFNLRFTWYGDQYRHLLKGYGIGIRQELEGDKRFVPWFNAPPAANSA